MIARRDAIDRSRLLGEALRGVRLRRGFTVGRMAKAMGIAKRTYQNFESGTQRIDVEKVHRAAEILSADPYAMLAAAEIGSAQFAVRCMEHQLMSQIMLTLQEFDEAAGDDIALLDPFTGLYHLTRMFEALRTEASERRALINGRVVGAPRSGPESAEKPESGPGAGGPAPSDAPEEPPR